MDSSSPSAAPPAPSAPEAGSTPAEPAAPPLRVEVMAGVTTFLTMSYIAVVNPQILSAAGLDPRAVLTATVLSAALGSILMGLVARLPYALAPGMGINALFAFELVGKRHLPPERALGLVVWAGVAFLLLSVTPLRREVARAIPLHLRGAVAGGIGLFLAFIGLKNAGLVVAHPATLVTLGTIRQETFLFLFGLVAAAWLHRQGKAWALLAAIVSTTWLGYAAGLAHPPERWVSLPDVSLVLKADLAGSLDVVLLPPLLTLLCTDLFDSLSTFLGVAQAAKLVDADGEPIRIEQALAVDAAATLISGLAGTSSATTYIESTAGIEAGGRTGRTAVVAGLCFVPLLFLGGLAEAVPPWATAPVLVLLGAQMLRSMAGGADRPLEDRLPAFVVLVLIPFSASITNGILAGFVLHTVLYLLVGRRRELPFTMWALAALALLLLGLDHSDALRGLGQEPS